MASDGFASNDPEGLRELLITIERRDWELWALLLVAMVVLVGGIFLVLVPAIFWEQQRFYVQMDLTPQLLAGLIGVISVSVLYFVHKHNEIRKLRFDSVVQRWEFEHSTARVLADPVTEVLDRKCLSELLTKECKRAQRNKTPLALLSIRVEGQRLGGTTLLGDLALAEAAAILKQSVRGSDHVLRVGSDEFVVILWDSDLNGAGVVSRRIQQALVSRLEKAPISGGRLELRVDVHNIDGEQAADKYLRCSNGIL
jgi:diguanylate cyclase (GGDEF)-like protein